MEIYPQVIINMLHKADSCAQVFVISVEINEKHITFLLKFAKPVRNCRED
jgi:hypothetical protein